MIDQQPQVVALTDAAVTKLRELTKEETNPDVGLRVYVYSGGCSGFRYGMMLEDAPTPEDNVLNASGIKVYVDGQSISLLQGSEIIALMTRDQFDAGGFWRGQQVWLHPKRERAFAETV